MKENNFSIKTIVAIGIGAAVFLVLGRFGSIPSGIPNTNIETAYAYLALMSVLYGPIAGFLIGFIGHALKDLIFYGMPWFSWVIASGIVGFVIGFLGKKFNLNEGQFDKSKLIKFNLSQIIANAIAWFLVAPTLDIFIYAEPANKVYLQGVVGGISNMVTVGILGSLILAGYSKSRVTDGSLEVDED